MRNAQSLSPAQREKIEKKNREKSNNYVTEVYHKISVNVCSFCSSFSLLHFPLDAEG